MADIAEANRKHWDGRAQDYDVKPWQKKMIEYIQSQLVEQRAFFGIEDGKEGVRLLDYACGPGTVSKALHPYTTSILGIDISPNMVSEYNKRFSTSSCTATNGNLLATTPWILDPTTNEHVEDLSLTKNPEISDFDVLIVGMGFHHFSEHAAALGTLKERVRAGGGVVGIVDLFPDESHYNALPSSMKAMMHKSGFTTEEMKAYMQEAGLVDVEVLPLEEPVVMQIQERDVERRIFFARGRRAS